MRTGLLLLVTGCLAAAAALASEADVRTPAAAAASRDPSGGEGSVLVRRGTWAVLSTSQGGVAIESRVEVLQDGRAGQRVLVRGSAWPQPIAARVLAQGSLEPTR